jgi:hypothetical protein
MLKTQKSMNEKSVEKRCKCPRGNFVVAGGAKSSVCWKWVEHVRGQAFVDRRKPACGPRDAVVSLGHVLSRQEVSIQ